MKLEELIKDFDRRTSIVNDKQKEIDKLTEEKAYWQQSAVDVVLKNSNLLQKWSDEDLTLLYKKYNNELENPTTEEKCVVALIESQIKDIFVSSLANILKVEGNGLGFIVTLHLYYPYTNVSDVDIEVLLYIPCFKLIKNLSRMDKEKLMASGVFVEWLKYAVVYKNESLITTWTLDELKEKFCNHFKEILGDKLMEGHNNEEQ